jgi:hypothetical protein
LPVPALFERVQGNRVRDVLAWLRVDADGEEKSDDTLVFSNEASEPLRVTRRPGLHA